MSIKEYQEKRTFNRALDPATEKLHTPRHVALFVVQKHDAGHLYFDFRLEVDGVLKSWAVPKGPSMNPKDKRLAIQVEDYPLSHAQFEGIMPEGNYSEGEVEIWDSGTYAYVGNIRDLSSAIDHGVLEIKLHGHKLKGLFTLVRTNMYDKGKDWLLMKKDDIFAVAHVYNAKEISCYEEVFL